MMVSSVKKFFLKFFEDGWIVPLGFGVLVRRGGGEMLWVMGEGEVSVSDPPRPRGRENQVSCVNFVSF